MTGTDAAPAPDAARGPRDGGGPGRAVAGRIKRFRRSFERLLEWITLALMAALAVVVIVGVGFRKAGAALVWYDEVASILLAWLTFYGAALAALKRAHIGFPKLVDSVSARLRVPLVVLGEAVTLAFFGLLTWAGWRVLMVLGGDYLASLPWVPLRLTQSVIPIGAALYIIAQLLSVPEVLAGRTVDTESEVGA